MAVNAYDIGEVVRFAATFTDSSDDNAVDPNEVTFSLIDPSGNQADYTYGVDSEIVRSAAGTYHALLTVDEAGTWLYRWRGTGTNAAVEAGQVYVRRSTFT